MKNLVKAIYVFGLVYFSALVSAQAAGLNVTFDDHDGGHVINSTDHKVDIEHFLKTSTPCIGLAIAEIYRMSSPNAINAPPRVGGSPSLLEEVVQAIEAEKRSARINVKLTLTNSKVSVEVGLQSSNSSGKEKVTSNLVETTAVVDNVCDAMTTVRTRLTGGIVENLQLDKDSLFRAHVDPFKRDRLVEEVVPNLINQEGGPAVEPATAIEI